MNDAREVWRETYSGMEHADLVEEAVEMRMRLLHHDWHIEGIVRAVLSGAEIARDAVDQMEREVMRRRTFKRGEGV